MSISIVLALLIAAGLVVLLLVGVRKPRTADEELGLNVPPPSTAEGRAGALATGKPLKPVIQALMSGRSTGLLTVSSPLGDTCTIGFLFGHMFHAECGSVEGEEALRMALSWASSTSSFNPKAQLPTKETIARVIDSSNP
jgi:hypothetical protein